MSIVPIQPINPSQLLTSTASGVSNTTSNQSQSFGTFLGNALGQVNQMNMNAEQQAIQLASGTAPNIANVMVSATQAQLAVDLTVQVRDKVIQAYNQIMNMQV